MNIKGNQRYKATKLAIRQVAIDMLENRAPAELNVREICQRVGINRSTFYLHFQDVYDMLDKFEADMSSEMVAEFTREGTRNLSEGFEHIFEFVRANASFYRAQLRNPTRKHIFPFVLPADYAERVAVMRAGIGPISEIQWRYQERFLLGGHGRSDPALAGRRLQRDSPSTHTNALCDVQISERFLVRLVGLNRKSMRSTNTSSILIHHHHRNCASITRFFR